MVKIENFFETFRRFDQRQKHFEKVESSRQKFLPRDRAEFRKTGVGPVSVIDHLS
jgi:hypothetical protein